MSRPFFFGGTQSSQQSQYLVQMKAGKMVRNGTTVSPIKDKKGLVYLHQSSDDNLLHFCWKDRTSGQLEDDLIIFPDDAEFLKVPQCTTGRVFVLKFKTSPRRLFFWSQEPKDDKDDELVSKINEYINNPMAAIRAAANSHGGSGSGSGGGHNLIPSNDLGLTTDEEFRNLFAGSGNVSAQQLMSMLDSGLNILPQGAGRLASLLNSLPQQQTTTATSTATNNRVSQQSSNVSTPAAPQTPSTTPAAIGTTSNSESSSASGGANSPGGPPGLRLADLQNIISGLSSSGQHLIVPEGADVNVDLSTTIRVEVLRPLLENEDFMKRISEMLPQLPNTTAPESINERFIGTVQSPQFQQALNSFCRALQSGQLGPLIQQFGLSAECVTAANSGDFEAFVKALQQEKKPRTATDDKSKSTTTTSNDGNKKKPDDEDDSMALD